MFRRSLAAKALRQACGVAIAVALLGALPSLAQVAVDSSSSTGQLVSAAANTITFAHTATGTNLLLVVGISINLRNNAGATATGVTFNGTALKLAGAFNNSVNDRRVEMWYEIAPAAGTHNVVVTMNLPGGTGTVGVVAGATTFSGADQTSPLRPFIATGGSGSTFASLDVPSATGEIVLDTLAINGSQTVTAFGPTQVPQWALASSGGGSAATDVFGSGSTRAGAPSVPLSETFSGTSDWALGAVSVRPLQANLGVTITGSSVFFPQNLTFTVTVTNAGPSAATGTQLTDTLPAGLTFVSATPSQGSCVGTQPIVCNLGTIAPGASATLTVVATPQEKGSYVNTASVTSGVPDLHPGDNTATAVAVAQINGCDGSAAAAGAALTGIINTYFPGTGTAAAGSLSITVGASTGSNTPISSGDLLLIIQMQNAVINDSNSPAYGDGSDGTGWTNLNSTGVYEFVNATSSLPTTGGTVTVVGAGPGGGLLNTYTESAANATQGQFTYQVIRVPHYLSATLASGATATAWNGSSGGVFAVDVAGALALGNATLNVDGLGFRGGAGLQLTGGVGANPDYVLPAPASYTGAAEPGADGSKGEGIAGTPRYVYSGGTYLDTGVDGYPNGSMARGAPGNAGGGGTDADPQTASPGGNDENTGGGGGANGGNGGVGGNAWSANLSTGGIGGTAFPASVNQIVMGGGGGAGTRNNDTGVNQASSGAAGGGIVIIRAGSLTGTATISANGAAAYNATANDGGGGGGAGGTLVIVSGAGGESGLTLAAHGGRGGDAWNTQAFSLADRHGPGGGGGGGVILVSGAAASVDVSAGANGVTLKPGVPYGATSGNPGVAFTNSSLQSTPGLHSNLACTDVAVTKTGSPNPVIENNVVTYTIVAINNGPLPATNVIVTDPLPGAVSYLSATSTAGSCSQANAIVSCNVGTLASGRSATVTIKVIALTPSVTTNTAIVSSDQPDSTPVNNDASQSETIEFPTSVSLESFTANGAPGQVLLAWKTGAEFHNLGFNVYRQRNGERLRINPSLIAGSALIMRDHAQRHGAKAYSWIDRHPPSSDARALYWLEDVDLNGTSTLHGPISVSSYSSQPIPAGEAMMQDASGSTAQSAKPQSDVQTADFSHVAEASAGIPTSTGSQQQTQFQLAAHPAVKIAVQHEGWYRITQPELVAAGLSPSADARFLRLFAEGIEQPILVTGAPSGQFDAQAAIEFYGTGIDTAYSDSRIYWLVAGNQPGLRIGTASGGGRGEQAPSFRQTVELRQRTSYFAALLKENTDNFFGALVPDANGEPVKQLLSVSNLASGTGDEANLRIVLQGINEDYTHDVSVSINDMALGQIVFEGQTEGTGLFAIPAGVLRNGANVVLLTAGNGDQSLVDHIDLTYPHSYTADSDLLKFTADAGAAVVVQNFTHPPTRLVDITSAGQPVALAFETKKTGRTYALTATLPVATAGTHTLLALSGERVAHPGAVSRNSPSSWHSAQPGSELVIITHPAFAAQAAKLARMHQAEGKSVALVRVDDLYDEFNFGEHSPYAIRDFLKTATAQWATAPRYLLLVGGASFDPRNYLGFGNFDLVPTKMIVTSELKTASDDWLSELKGNGFASIPTGRLPVRTADDANTVVEKIVKYETSQSASNVALLVADRDDPSLSFTQETQAVQKEMPKSVSVNDVFASTDSNAKADILSGINSGPMLVNYLGHGSVGVWSGDGILFDEQEADALTNGSHLPVFLSIDCLNGYFEDPVPSPESLAVELMLAKNGGAVAVWASSGLTSAGPQFQMDRALVGAIFSTPSPALGDAIQAAKSGINDSDVRRTYILFGDPLLHLSWPGTPQK